MNRILLAIALALSLSAHASQYWMAGVYSYTEPNTVTGVRSTISVERAGGKSQKAAWTSAHIGDRWVQLGWQTWGNGPKYIVMCFTLISSRWQRGCPGTEYFVHPEMTGNTMVTFDIINVPGTTLWQLFADGILTSEFDMGAAFVTGARASLEQAPSDKPERFPLVEMDLALEFQTDGAWAPPRTAYSALDAWGVEGTLQNPALRPGQIRAGSAIPIVPHNTLLWSIEREATVFAP